MRIFTRITLALLLTSGDALPVRAGVIPAPPPTLRQLGGRPLWVPICSRRGPNGSAASTDSTNTAVMDQQMCQVPAWGNVSAIKLVYCAFDVTQQGEMDRPITATMDAAIFQPGNLGLNIVTSAAASSGATTLSFSGSTLGVNSISAGQQISASGIASGAYVTAVNYVVGASNSVTTVTVTLSSATSAAIAAGSTVSFVGQITPATFGGARSLAMTPRHGVYISDPIPIQASASSLFGVRTYASFSGTGIMLMDVPGNSGRAIGGTVYGITYAEFDQRGTSLTDTTMTPLTGSNTGGGYWGPIAVLALMTPAAGYTATGAVMVIGDSIAAGTGDLADSYYFQGYIQRSLEANVPFVTMARGSTTAYEALTRGDGRYAMSIDTGITDVLLEDGRNDIQLFGVTAANLENYIKTIAARYTQAGKHVWCFTVPPTTISSDGFTTLANQSWIQTAYTASATVASSASSITLSGSSGVAAGQTVVIPPPALYVGTGSTAAGGTAVTLTSVSGLYVGQAVYGPGIAAGTTIAGISGLTITLSTPASLVVPANSQLTFGTGIAPGTTISAWNASTKVATLSTPTIASIASGTTIDTGSSTINAAETQREAYNAYLRTSAGLGFLGCTGLIDDDLYMADLGGSYKWRVDLGAASVDGVHPNQVLHQAVVNAGIINASLFPAR